MDKVNSPRLLIFIVAYQAEKTLRWVLERIPKTVLEDYDCEVLIIDDASKDNTFEIGNQFRLEQNTICLRVLRNKFNLGYGGNQKVGYAYAIKKGFDLVALLHGDGQYAPEELPRMLEPLLNGEADAVFGSRFLNFLGALKGGMPLYKFFGNRILSALQNILLRKSFSEYHSGYRIYSTDALRRIPFKINTNDFHFDTEIILQLLDSGARITELPIPTYYGDEICRVQGIPYAVHVLAATLHYVFHRWGLLYQRRFDTRKGDQHHYSLKLDFASSHQWALDRIPDGSSVIDLGAGPFTLAPFLIDRGCKVVLVDKSPPLDPPDQAEVVIQDLDKSFSFDFETYDHILLLDIIEHLVSPEDFLAGLRAQFTHKPATIILSTPNIAFISQRIMLLLGQFNYGKSGILDDSHFRLFTFRGIRNLLQDEGFQIKEMIGVPAPFPKAIGEGRLSSLLLRANLLLIHLSRTLFSYQIFCIAESTPSLDFLLSDAERSERGEDIPARSSGCRHGAHPGQKGANKDL